MDSLIADAERSMAQAFELAQLARRYCALIDAAQADCDDWLNEVAVLLPRLQAAVAPVWIRPGAGHVPNTVDLDERFELFSRLHRLLADRDAYWLEFDRGYDGLDTMTGSLADDLTDIYCELSGGLRVLHDDPAGALDAWAIGYDRHWARHLADAERHLAALAADQRLGAKA